MTFSRIDFLDILEARGFIHQCTDRDGMAKAAAAGPVTVYVGYDCTADSLHVGNLLSIMMLRWMQRCGHRPLVLMGGGTTRIGDPSGRDESRRLLDDATIESNKASIKQVFARFLTFGDGPEDALMEDNAAWLDTLAYIPFLRDFGRHFSVNRMLGFDSVKLRLEREQPLSFLEFNYMILQAYDFLELYRRHGCVLQLGGSDQWGNIVNGVELARRVGAEAGEEIHLYGLTCPLLTTASGQKMGKTASGAVWLNPDRLSPYDYWQYWRNTEDADVGRFLRLYTELPLDQVARLAALDGAEINDAKKVLATEATALCHGRAAAEEAAETARRAFEQGLSDAGLPTVEIPRDDLAAGLPAFDLFRRAQLAGSGGEARRLIKGGGARLNDAVITEETRTITLDDADADGTIKLSAGKKRHVLVRSS